MSSAKTEIESRLNPEKLKFSRDPAALHLHLYQPPRHLLINYQNKTIPVFDITGQSDSFPGFNERITKESYQPLITENFLSHPSLSWNLYGVTADWMAHTHPELISKLQQQIETGSPPPVGDTYLHIILPFLSRPHKDMMLTIAKRSYQSRWHCEMESVWLPESGVDQDTIDALVSANIKAVHLREHQVRASVPDSIYRLTSKAGEIAAIVGHNHYSGIIGFAKPWADSFFRELKQYRDVLGHSPRLSIDGETIGHWWKRDEGSFAFLKYFLQYLDNGLDSQNLNYQTKENFPSATLVENTSWSCLDDGLGRWQGSTNCSCALSNNHDEAALVRKSKKDLFNKLTLASDRLDAELDSYFADWRELYIEWFLAVKENLANNAPVSASMFGDKNLERLFISAFIRDLGWTSCGWYFGDVQGFERQIPANSLHALSQINNWLELRPQY